MKKIKLTKGYEAIVDDEDFEYVNQWRWHYKDNGYAESQENKKHFYMHTLINKTPKNYLTDHINRNTLDNRKNNLRTCNKRVNSINRGTQINNTSKFKGVSWDKQHFMWAAYVWNMGNKIHLGLYKNLMDAVKSRKDGEKQYYGL